MNKYKVKVLHLFAELIDVEAKNQEEAILSVSESIQKNNHDSKAQYEMTFPPNQWPIITEEKYLEMIQAELEKRAKAESTEESNIITP